tara:strand:- start:24467 stop:25135 length:669 start_codon:yes stop_codon:yes gene_type:complete
MSTFKELKDVILGCASRANSSFQAGASNLVDIAINNAVIHAQRNQDFEWNKGTVTMACSPKGSIDTVLDEAGEAVKIKRIIKAYGTAVPTGDYDLSIPYLSKVSQIGDNTKARLNLTHVDRDTSRVIHQGKVVYMSPSPGDVYTLYFEAVKWLPRLSRDNDTNFLFDYAFDYLLYRSIVELNFYVREDERFNVTKDMIMSAWQSVIAWDASLISPTETEIEL